MGARVPVSRYGGVVGAGFLMPGNKRVVGAYVVMLGKRYVMRPVWTVVGV